MESARFAAAMGENECTMCRLAPPEFERAVAFANYDDEMREMLHLLKFDGQRRMAERVLGERMAAAVMQLREAASNDLVVVPVPLFAARERERGFNQSRLLAASAIQRVRRVAPQWKLRLETKALLRVKDTRAMFTLDPRQRRRNLQGAFRVADAALVRGREVLLLDDIMTTGATARECSRVLRRAGATKVWVVTAAKAQPASAVAKFEAADVATWQPQPTARSVPLLEPDEGRRIRF
jgi:ComF family protein